MIHVMLVHNLGVTHGLAGYLEAFGMGIIWT